MYLGKTLAVIGTVYIAIHVANGAWICYNEFCPGDNASDWVYEYTDDSGKKFIVDRGTHVPAEEYQGTK